jgi:hypothetical protein
LVARNPSALAGAPVAASGIFSGSKPFNISAKEPTMKEKRCHSRRRISTPIVCKRLNSTGCELPIDGSIKNCCSAGFYAELKAPIRAGAVLVVGMPGDSLGYVAGQRTHTLGLAEVRWSRPMHVDGEACFAVGLKYLMAC